MLQRPPTRLMPALLLVVGALVSPFAHARQQPLPEERPWQKDFGSSVKRLKWDEQKKAAAEVEDARRKEKGAGTDDEIVRVETSLVVSNVLVLNRQGRAVLGLTRDDFVVSEDGQPQEVGVFATGDSAKAPRSIVLVIDYSGSLTPYLKTSVEAAKVLVDQLAPGDRMAIVTDDVKLLADFTQDKKLLKKKLESLKSLAEGYGPTHGWGAGHSLQYSALLAVLGELFDEEDVRPVVIFQTDGDELAVLRLSADADATLRRPFSLGDVYRAAEGSRATVYSVIPGPRLIGLPPDEQLKRSRKMIEARDEAMREAAGRASGGFWTPTHRRTLTVAEQQRYAEHTLLTQKALVGLAQLTGGWTEFLEQPSQAAEIYSLISADISSRYVVGYYPANKARDGARRKVSIEVRGHPEYTLLGRKSYRAPKE
jgi:VWFA-related protein